MDEKKRGDDLIKRGRVEEHEEVLNKAREYVLFDHNVSTRNQVQV